MPLFSLPRKTLQQQTIKLPDGAGILRALALLWMKIQYLHFLIQEMLKFH